MKVEKKVKFVKPKYPQLSINLLLLAAISALFVLFVFMLKQRTQIVTETMPPAPTIVPVKNTKELNLMLDELNFSNSDQLLNKELQNLNSDSAGI